MPEKKHIRHYHRHLGFSYPTSISQRLYAVVAPLITVSLFFGALSVFSIIPVSSARLIPYADLTTALLFSLLRLSLAYLLALVISFPLALLIDYSPATERVFLPLFDITESIPALAFFPLVIAVFLKFNLFNGAAVFILFLSMVWNLVFSIVGGLKVIPTDIKEAAQVMKIRGVAYLRRVLIPAVFPYLITGSLLAWAQGWNILIVAEVLHTYIPGGTSAYDVVGIGSVLVHAIASGQNNIFIATLLAMIATIAFLNFFVWQKLLRYAERYRFE